MSEPWRISSHAAERLMDMCVPPQVIKECLENPTSVYDQSDSHKRLEAYEGDLRQIYMLGTLSLVVNPHDRVVVTAYVAQREFSRDDLDYVWKGGGWVDY